jgi:TetR/AcrR family transcriptional repressor of nem operon
MPRVKQFNEEEVLTKAMELFWKKGYYATSMQDLVDYLGINRASLYDTFGGKKELFGKALCLYRTTYGDNVAAFLKAQPAVKIGIQRLFERAIDETLCDADRKGCFVVNTASTVTPAETEVQTALLENKTEVEAALYGYLSWGVQQGELSEKKDLKGIATLLFTLYNGLKIVAKIEGDREKMSKSVKAMLTILD